MIRGVNKYVIEISDTGNDCFERAILFVRPKSADKDSEHLKKSGADYISGMKIRPWFYSGRRHALAAAKFLLSAGVGGVIVAVLIHLIG